MLRNFHVIGYIYIMVFIIGLIIFIIGKEKGIEVLLKIGYIILGLIIMFTLCSSMIAVLFMIE